MGQPSATEPWGWQLEGHHLVINYFVLRDQVVMTPLFVGGEPVLTTTGKYAGNTILQVEQDRGLAFMRAPDAEQQRRATLSPEKTRDGMQAGMNQDNLMLPYQGLEAGGLSAPLKVRLRDCNPFVQQHDLVAVIADLGREPDAEDLRFLGCANRVREEHEHQDYAGERCKHCVRRAP